MLYFRNCVIALVTPWGRLPVIPFAVMCLGLIAAHGAIQIHLTELGDDLPPYNSWSMSLFALMWMTFCVTSRRFHDGGKTAFYLVPLLVITFASYLAVFDDTPLAYSSFEEDRDLLRWAERARLVLQIANMAAMVFALTRPSDFSDNAFGPVFYEKKSATRGPARVAAQAAPALAAPRKPVVSEPAEPQRAPRNRQDFLASGPRGRITPAESSRRGPERFGRR